MKYSMWGRPHISQEEAHVRFWPQAPVGAAVQVERPACRRLSKERSPFYANYSFFFLLSILSMVATPQATKQGPSSPASTFPATSHGRIQCSPPILLADGGTVRGTPRYAVPYAARFRRQQRRRRLNKDPPAWSLEGSVLSSNGRRTCKLGASWHKTWIQPSRLQSSSCSSEARLATLPTTCRTSI
jgi:hypothetical protein